MPPINFSDYLPAPFIDFVETSIDKIWEVVSSIFEKMRELAYLPFSFWDKEEVVEIPSTPVSSPKKKVYQPLSGILSLEEEALVRAFAKRKGAWFNFSFREEERQRVYDLNPYATLELIAKDSALRNIAKNRKEGSWRTFSELLATHTTTSAENATINKYIENERKKGETLGAFAVIDLSGVNSDQLRADLKTARDTKKFFASTLRSNNADIAGRLAFEAYQTNHREVVAKRKGAEKEITKLLEESNGQGLLDYVLRIHTPEASDLRRSSLV